MSRTAGLLAWLALVAAGIAAAAEPRLEVRIEPDRIGSEDPARLVVTVADAGKGVTPPELPELENLEVVAGPSTEQQFNWINGVSSFAVRFVWIVRARAPGTARVGQVTVDLDGRTLSAEPVVVEVVEGSLRQLPRGRRMPVDPFGDLLARRDLPEARIELRRLISDRDVALGEPVRVTVVLDTTAVGIERFEWTAAPSFPGWWAQPVELPESITPEMVEHDGIRYQRYPVYRAVLIPIKTGALELPAVAARVGVRGRGFFAPLEALERSTGPATVEVRRRPAPPSGYAGAVGELVYTAALEPGQVELGSSTLLTVRLEGQGNLPLVEPPAAWPSTPDCEVFPPEEEESLTIDQAGIRGHRTWRSTLVPHRAGRLTLAPVTLAVFDPRSGRYVEQAVGPLELEVTSPPPTATPTPDPSAVAELTATPPPAAERGAEGQVPSGLTGILVALAAGLALGGLATWLALRRRALRIPPRREGSTPAERARELQGILERWWLERGEPARVRGEMEELRRDLEAVRFAPGRADHSDTVEDLERQLRRLMRRA